MPAPAHPGDLTAAELGRLHAALDAFEEAVARDPDTKLDAYLPPAADPLRPLYLLELVKADISVRWTAGDERLVEDYLPRYPDLPRGPADLAALLWEEFQARKRYGQEPTLSAYERRFPDAYPLFRQKAGPEPAAKAETKPPDWGAPSPRVATIHSPVGADPPPPPAPPLASAERVLSVGGGYKLIKRIGSGSFGEVWRAEAPGGVEAAVKIIIRSLDHEEAKRELRALELIKRLRHPFLLQTQAFWPLEDRLVIVMELADGSLRDRLVKDRRAGRVGVPVEELLALTREAAEALDFLNEKEVIHRDVKPDNILVVGRHAKVADFGLVRGNQPNAASVGSTAGTPGYMAPELWYGKRATPASDLYGLAATYVEMRRGRPPFAGVGFAELMLGHLEADPDLVGLEPAEADVVRRALAKEPTRRHKSCLAFVEDLRKVLRSGSFVAVPDTGQAVREALKTPPVDVSPLAAAPAATVHEPRPPKADPDPPETLNRGAPRTVLEGQAGAAPPPFEPGRRRRWPLVVGLGLIVGTVVIGISQIPWGPRDQKQGSQSGGNGTTGTTNGTTLTTPAVVSTTTLTTSPATTGTAAPTTRTEPPKVVDVKIEGFAPLPGTTFVEIGSSRYPMQIVRPLPKGEGVEFRLIHEANGKLEPFYIMRDKVSVKLLKTYGADAKIQADGRDPGGPKEMPTDDLPAVWISADEAHKFCEWLGGENRGKLPSARQWDAAGGRYTRPAPAGPYKGDLPDEDWNFGPRTENGRLRPRRVGKSSKDESVFGVRDMAWNGKEWTRSWKRTDSEDYDYVIFTSQMDYPVILRGAAYSNTMPFKFGKAEDEIFRFVDGKPEEPTRDQYVGFRAVFEPKLD